jgi:hypothetical protein
MMLLLAPTGYKYCCYNKRSLFVDKKAVDVGAVKGFYFFIFEPQLVVVLNMKKRNRAEHGMCFDPRWLEKKMDKKVPSVFRATS